MGRPLKIKESTTVDIGYPDVGSLTAPAMPATLNSTEYVGVVGGVRATASATYPVLKCRVFIAGQGAEEDGVILRQKGSTKYLVLGDSSSATGVCVLADEADGALTEGNMNITFTIGDSTAISIKRLTNKFALNFNDDKYVINFWTDEGTLSKSGTAGDTYELAIAEKYTST